MSERAAYDVAVVGGGISGASAFLGLVRAGYRAVLVERGDVASGTSQASAMWVWGGSIYLRQGDVAAVRRFSADREEVLGEPGAGAAPRTIRYLPSTRSARLAHAGLFAAWLLGGGARGRPRREEVYPERSLLRGDLAGPALRHEEAGVGSDARFVLSRVLAGRDLGGRVLHHAELLSGRRAGRGWSLRVRDRLAGREHDLRARWVVAAAGGWTDAVAARCGVTSAPYRHAFSKGVFLAVPRPAALESALVFDSSGPEEVLALIPWGPVALWGPTEEEVSGPLAAATAADVRYLLRALNRRVARPVAAGEVVALRCGVRPLAVRRRRAVASVAAQTRRAFVHTDPAAGWTAVYGGKLTGSPSVARSVVGDVARDLRPSGAPAAEPIGAPATPPRTVAFPGVPEPLPDPAWCRDRELCATLADYLRRRTNVAQWVPRGGLGRADEHARRLRDLAAAFHPDPDAAVAAYRAAVVAGFDRVLAAAGAPRPAGAPA